LAICAYAKAILLGTVFRETGSKSVAVCRTSRTQFTACVVNCDRLWTVHKWFCNSCTHT